MISRGLLLDSSVLFWLSSNTKFLGKDTKREISNRSIYFSTVSVAELSFKASIGKLTLKPSFVNAWIDNGFQALSFNLDAADHFSSFSNHEIPDPFDRQIMAIARANNLTLVTSDRKILKQGFTWVLDATT
jgi:PIN domain nuclease of toxin-antitoxin system